MTFRSSCLNFLWVTWHISQLVAMLKVFSRYKGVLQLLSVEENTHELSQKFSEILPEGTLYHRMPLTPIYLHPCFQLQTGFCSSRLPKAFLWPRADRSFNPVNQGLFFWGCRTRSSSIPGQSMSFTMETRITLYICNGPSPTVQKWISVYPLKSKKILNSERIKFVSLLLFQITMFWDFQWNCNINTFLTRLYTSIHFQGQKKIGWLNKTSTLEDAVLH